MSELPYFNYYMGDMIADTAHLSTEEFGAYIRILQHYYKKRQGPQNDKKTLKNLTGLTPVRFQKIYPVIMEFFEVRDGRLWQKRVEKELQIAQEKSEKARQSANARWMRTQCERNANGYANTPISHMQSESESFNNPLPQQAGESSGEERQPPKNSRAHGTNPRALGTNPRAVAGKEAHERKERAKLEEQIQRQVDYAWNEANAISYVDWKKQQERARSPGDEVVL